MKEQLIKFETAKLTKEKGFNEFCFSLYDNGGNLVTDYSDYSPNMRYYNDKMNPSKDNPNWWLANGCSAPTQSLLQKWLREKHNIHLWVSKSDNHNKQFTVHVYLQDTKNILNDYKTYYNWIETYEEALEKGLQEALKILKQ